MTICERLFAIIEDRGIKSADLCRATGISPSAFANWKQRGTDPPAKHILPICEFLDCSLEYLLTGEETKKEPVPGISENGREMLALYELLPERQQILLIGRLQEMVEPLASPIEKDIAIASDGEAI